VLWKHVLVGLTGLALSSSFARAGEAFFRTGPQELEGQRYYWFAPRKLEVTLPDDVAPDDRREVLFGSKGPAPRTLHFEYDGRRGVPIVTLQVDATTSAEDLWRALSSR
jgi:hypothetical protein